MPSTCLPGEDHQAKPRSSEVLCPGRFALVGCAMPLGEATQVIRCLCAHYIYSPLCFSRRHDSAGQITVLNTEDGGFPHSRPSICSVRRRQSLGAHCQQTVETHKSEGSSEAPVHPLLNTSNSQVRPGCSGSHLIRFVRPTGSLAVGMGLPHHLTQTEHGSAVGQAPSPTKEFSSKLIFPGLAEHSLQK